MSESPESYPISHAYYPPTTPQSVTLRAPWVRLQKLPHNCSACGGSAAESRSREEAKENMESLHDFNSGLVGSDHEVSLWQVVSGYSEEAMDKEKDE